MVNSVKSLQKHVGQVFGKLSAKIGENDTSIPTRLIFNKKNDSNYALNTISPMDNRT